MPKPFLEARPLESAEYTWETPPGYGPADGIYQMIIAKDPETGVFTRFMKFEPGAKASGGPLSHDAWEEVFIFEGSLICDGKEYPKGTVCIRPPGTPHGPFHSPNGMLAYEIHYK